MTTANGIRLHTIPAPRSLPDHLARNLRVLFVGINPGLRSAQVGHHYAGATNRFWKLLYAARLVSEPLTYRDDARVLDWRIGLTNLVGRPTSGMDGLQPDDYARGREVFLEKIRDLRPQTVALLGVTLYSILFPDEPKQTRRPLGLQRLTLSESRVFLLPNPSGRNAGYSYDTMLQGFQALARYVNDESGRRRHTKTDSTIL